MKSKILISTSLLSVFFIGCGKQEIDIDKMPEMQMAKILPPVKKKKGSLYSRKGASLFSDKKDLQIGDIIQVLIQETLTNDSTDTRKTSKSNSSSLGGGVFSVPQGPLTGAVNNLNKTLGAGFTSTTANTFKGASSSSADEEFTTTISAIIEQTYQNGNYFIKGSKEMLINGQKQDIKISGVIRPYDISPENTVFSYQLANLKVLYEKDGEEIDSLSKGWGTKIVETIWPF